MTTTPEPAPGQHWRGKRPGADQKKLVRVRSFDAIHRVVVEIVEHASPFMVGRTARMSLKTLRGDYTLEAGGADDVKPRELAVGRGKTKVVTVDQAVTLDFTTEGVTISLACDTAFIPAAEWAHIAKAYGGQCARLADDA